MSEILSDTALLDFYSDKKTFKAIACKQNVIHAALEVYSNKTVCQRRLQRLSCQYFCTYCGYLARTASLKPQSQHCSDAPWFGNHKHVMEQHDDETRALINTYIKPELDFMKLVAKKRKYHLSH